MSEISDAIESECEGVVTKWVVVAEVYDVEAGESNLHQISSADLALWDRIGLLGFAYQGSLGSVEPDVGVGDDS